MSAQIALFQTASRVSMTLEAMQQLARYLADIPGRKNVIWLSGSFPAGIVPDSMSGSTLTYWQFAWKQRLRLKNGIT